MAVALFSEVTEAVRREDTSALRALLVGNPLRVHWVGEQRAVQLTACDGAVIAHYPVSRAMAGQLGK